MKFLLFFLTVLLMPSFCFADQWPSNRGTEQGEASLKYSGKNKINEWFYQYKSNRRYKPGLAVWASPALAIIGGHPMAFIGGYDQTLHALDLVDKKVLWRKITNAEIQNSPVIANVDGNDIVFFTSADRSVYACNAFNGEKFWTKELIPASNSLGDVSMGSPYIADNRVYVTCFAYDKSLPRNQQNGMLYCLNIKNGDIIFSLKISSGFLSSPVGFKRDKSSYIVVAAKRGIVQCFDVTDSSFKKVWSFQMPHEVLGTPVLSTQTNPPMMFLGSKYGNLIAIDLRNGKEVWQYMAGNWIDNSACIGQINGQQIVYVGSYDYNVYAFLANTGQLLWKQPVGGEVYSAPCFFNLHNKPMLSVASLDNHIYVLDAENGKIKTSFFTGNPIWDKLAKGEISWGSSAVLEAGDESAIIHGSFNDMVYVLPLVKECSLVSMARSVKSLWISLLIVFVLFTGVILPIVLKIRGKE